MGASHVGTDEAEGRDEDGGRPTAVGAVYDEEGGLICSGTGKWEYYRYCKDEEFK